MTLRGRTLVIFFSQAVTQAVTVGLGIVMVHLLSQELYGSYRQVQLISTFVTAVLGLQIPASLYYFVPKLPRDHRRQIVVQSVGLSCLLGLAAGVIMIASANLLAKSFGNEALAPLLRVYAPFPLASLILSLVPAFAISLDLPVHAGVYTLASALARALPAVVLASLGASLGTILLGTVATSLLLSAWGVLMMWSRSAGPSWSGWDLLGPQISYVIPLSLASLVGVANRQVDQFLISLHFDPARYAVYAAGAFELPVVGIVTASVGNAIMPDLVSRYDQGRITEVLQIWHASVRRCSLVIYPVFAWAIFSARDLITALYPESYGEAVWPFSVYLFELPLRVAVYGSLLRACGRTTPVAVGAAIALIVNASVGFLLVRFGGSGRLAFVGPSIGAAAAEVAAVAYLICSAARTTGVGTTRLMPWSYLGRTLCVAIAAGAGSGIVVLADLPLVARLAGRTAVFLALFGLLAFRSGVLGSEELAMLRRGWRTALVKAGQGDRRS